MLVYNAGMQTMACTASLQLECRTEYDENAGISECGAPKSLGGCHHLSPITKLRHLSLANWDSLVLSIAPERAILQVALSIAALQIAFCAPFVLQHMASPYWLSRWELCQNELDFGRYLCQEMVFPKPYHNLFSWNRSTLNKSYIHSVFCQSENVDGKLISLRGTGPLRFSAKFSSMPVISKSRQSWEDEQKVPVCKTNKHQVHCSSLWLSLLDGLCWNICQVGKVDDDFIVGGGDLIFWKICPR